MTMSSVWESREQQSQECLELLMIAGAWLNEPAVIATAGRSAGFIGAPRVYEAVTRARVLRSVS